MFLLINRACSGAECAELGGWTPSEYYHDCSGGIAVGLIGPDVIVGDPISGYHRGSVGTIHSYSVGTTSCNIGDMDPLGIANTNEPPVIAQNIYRLRDSHPDRQASGMGSRPLGVRQDGRALCGSDLLVPRATFAYTLRHG